MTPKAELILPIDVSIIQNLSTVLPADAISTHIALLCIVGFYWLLYLVEYLAGQGRGHSQAFKLGDTSFEIDDRVVLTATDDSLNDVDMSRITQGSLMFTDQKNSVKGEQIMALMPPPWPMTLCSALAKH
jgi:hypothetical protein